MQLFSSWTGSDFLLFYAILLGLASLASWWVPAYLREPGRRSESDDVESIAMLAGGRRRLAESLLADLFVRGALAPAEKGRLHVRARDVSASPAGIALLAIDAPLTLAEARKAVHVHAERISARLRRAGLLLRPEDYNRLRWFSVAPFICLIIIGIYRQRAGSTVGEPSGFLVVLLILTAVLAVIRFVTCDPRTAAGMAVVQQIRVRNGRFARAPRPEEAAMAVALFGTGVLAGTPWEAVHAMRQKDSDSGGDGSTDGGCGGGGCGGCGG